MEILIVLLVVGLGMRLALTVIRKGRVERGRSVSAAVVRDRDPYRHNFYK
jgi:uncharacterized membrane protein SpoIIM required for sporulation